MLPLCPPSPALATVGHRSPGTGLSARQNCEPWEDMLTHWPSADQGEAWRGGPCTWWSSKVGLYEAPAGVTSTAGAWEGLVCRCFGRWRKTRPRPGETRESHESSSLGHQRWDRGSGRQWRPQHSPQPSSWEGPVASERCRKGLAPRVQCPQDKQGLCSPFLRRVPVIQVVGDTCKVVQHSHQAATEIGSRAGQRA